MEALNVEELYSNAIEDLNSWRKSDFSPPELRDRQQVWPPTEHTQKTVPPPSSTITFSVGEWTKGTKKKIVSGTGGVRR
jgi:hypothetical protein